MDRFKIGKMTAAPGESWNGKAFEIIDTMSDRSTAIELARMYAAEHAARLDVDVTETPWGAQFVTNNGTHVRYESIS